MPKTVWFGTTAPPAGQIYDGVIIDSGAGDGMVEAQELRAALQAAGYGNVPGGNIGSVSTTTVPGLPGTIHTVGWVTFGSIGTGSTGYAISLVELTQGPIHVAWGPGGGNFIKFFPGKLSDVCFVRGTLIETESGPKAIEDLIAGDLLVTKDHGLQPIRWIGSSWRSASDLAANPNLLPIKIRKDSFGPGKPNRDLKVSPQHRILVQAAQEVLVAAKHLCHFDGIQPAQMPNGTQYFHLVLPRHEIIYANGLEAETLYPGPEALKALPPEAISEIDALFPGLIGRGDQAFAARPLTKGKEARAMLRSYRSAAELRVH